MKAILILAIALLVSSCSTARVLVRDCQKLDGIDMQNCERIKNL